MLCYAVKKIASVHGNVGFPGWERTVPCARGNVGFPEWEPTVLAAQLPSLPLETSVRADTESEKPTVCSNTSPFTLKSLLP